MQWNADLYDNKHQFVSKHGTNLVELLAPKPGELILDLGCGTGDLAQVIANWEAIVKGIDSSEDMLASARRKYPLIDFEQASADDFQSPDQFDAVFSNATLHWVLNYQGAIDSIYNCLKPGGRFIAEFGGKGNVNSIINALKAALVKHGYAENAAAKRWYFPSLSEYAGLLEARGFRMVYAVHFDRDTSLTADTGLRNWITQFGHAFLVGLPEAAVEQILSDVEAELRPTNYRDSEWHADYVRLRIKAIKI